MRIQVSAVPTASAAAVVRRALERRVALRDAGFDSLHLYLEAQGHTVVIKELRAAVGGLEACVSPVAAGRYRFVCDPAPTPDETLEIGALADPTEFRLAFRLAHEYAHTLFAVSGELRAQHRADEVEEAKCDLFALAFLLAGDGPEGLPQMRAELAPFMCEALVA